MPKVRVLMINLFFFNRDKQKSIYRQYILMTLSSLKSLENVFLKMLFHDAYV